MAHVVERAVEGSTAARNALTGSLFSTRTFAIASP